MTETGIWEESEKDFHAFDYYLAKFIGRSLNKEKTILDFGCGLGSYLSYFQDIGFKNLIGIDGYKLSNREFHNIYAHDLTTPLDLQRKGNVISLECGEHIPPIYTDIFIDNLIRHLQGDLIISWAVENQQGIGHVNCQSNDYVIQALTSRGLKYDPDRTAKARQNVSNHTAYFRETLLIFYNEIV